MSENAPYAPPPLPPNADGRAPLPQGGPMGGGGRSLDDFELAPDENAKSPVLEGGTWKPRGQQITEKADDETLAAVERMLRGENAEDKKATEAKVARVFVGMLSGKKSIDTACDDAGMSSGEFNLHLLRNPTWQRHCDKLIRNNLIAQGSKIPEILHKIENAGQQERVANLRAALNGSEKAYTAGSRSRVGGGGAKKAPSKIGSIGGLTAKPKDPYDPAEQADYDLQRADARKKFEEREPKNE